MNMIYDPGHSDEADDQYQKNRKLYSTLYDKLNESIRNHTHKMAALSVISQHLFLKRNSVSIKKTPSLYRQSLARLLPMYAPKFFPEVRSFLKVLGVTCTPDEFDNAVLLKIDIFTQELYGIRDHRYLELKIFSLNWRTVLLL